VSFRYSTISNFHKCQKYYELKEILGLSDGIEKSGDVAFGSCLHLGVQDLFEGGDGLDVFNTYWNLQASKNLEYSRLDHGDLGWIGAELLKVFRDEHMHKFAPLIDISGVPMLECKMHGSIGQHKFSGTVDAVAEFGGHVSVVDWKTAAYPYDAYKIQCNEQMYGYVELIRQTYGIDVKQVVYGVFVKDPKNPRFQIKKALVTPEKQQAVLANISAVCDQITTAKLAQVFTKNPGQCVVGKRVCPFFTSCHGGERSGGEET
jgi:hypothetical protein